MNSREQLYEIWAPPGAVWSAWAKPVVFASMSSADLGLGSVPAAAADSIPGADGSTALVVNMPGAASVALGVSLAGRGYRPVPLFNAVPVPVFSSFIASPGSAVDVRAIAHALVGGAARVAQAGLRDDSPPAFLLDWNRNGAGAKPPPGWFDNRSVSFTTDFPSGARLRAHGIRRALLVQPADTHLQSDLSHTLLRWQEAGLSIERLDPGSVSSVPVTVPKPTWFGFAWQRVLAAIGLRRSWSGGFGGWVPEPSSSSFG